VPFKPINPFPLIHRIARSKLYQTWVILCLITCVALLLFTDSMPSVLFIMITGSINVFIELSRFDRSMARAVMSRFEWLVLTISLVQMSVFACWAQQRTNPLSVSIPVLSMYVTCVAFILGLSDAAPTYPYAIRLGGAVLLMLNTARTLIVNFYSTYYDAYPVCFIFCTDTRVLALSGNTVAFLFLLKYAYSLLRYPRRCIIACMHLFFTLERTRTTRRPKSVTAYLTASGPQAERQMYYGAQPSSSAVDVDAFASSSPASDPAAVELNPSSDGSVEFADSGDTSQHVNGLNGGHMVALSDLPFLSRVRAISSYVSTFPMLAGDAAAVAASMTDKAADDAAARTAGEGGIEQYSMSMVPLPASPRMPPPLPHITTDGRNGLHGQAPLASTGR